MHAVWPSENIILGLLCERPMHGYELARLAQEDAALRTIWRIGRSEVYFLLGKLRKHGLIVEYAEEQQSGPARTIYAPTEEGRAAFARWLQTPELRPRNLRTALLAKVWLALRYDPHATARFIEAQEQALRDWLERKVDQHFENDVLALAQHLRVAHVQATLNALEEFRRLADGRAGGSTGGDEHACKPSY